MATKARLLIVNYFASTIGGVSFEFFSDRIAELRDLELEVAYLTGPSGDSLPPVRGVVHIRPLPWSKRDLLQLSSASDVDQRSKAGITPIRILLGAGFDRVFAFLAGSHSDGKYSWIIPAIWRGLGLRGSFKPNLILSMGGPTSAHVVSLILARLLNKPLIVELQDPLIGTQMKFSRFAGILLNGLERRLVRHSSKVVVTSAQYLNILRAKYPASRNIHLVYPLGALHSLPNHKPQKALAPQHLSLVHLGSLYGTRNLDLFFEALELIERSSEKSKAIRLTNVGNMTIDQEERYSDKGSFSKFQHLARAEALNLASTFDALLLVQHLDSRSLETVPYKLFDYLNLGLPIIGLTMSDEISKIVDLRGGKIFDASADDVASIAGALREFLRSDLSRGETQGSRGPAPKPGRIIEAITSCSLELCDCLALSPNAQG